MWFPNVFLQLSNMGLDVMTELVRRMERIYRPYIPSVLACVIDRLGNFPSQVISHLFVFSRAVSSCYQWSLILLPITILKLYLVTLFALTNPQNRSIISFDHSWVRFFYVCCSVFSVYNLSYCRRQQRDCEREVPYFSDKTSRRWATDSARTHRPSGSGFFKP